MNKIALTAAALLTAGTFGLAAIAQDANESEFERADGNNDMMVSWEEARGVYPTVSEAIFNQADANGDGSLDESEFTALRGLTAGLDGAVDFSSESSMSSEPSESSESSEESSQPTS